MAKMSLTAAHKALQTKKGESTAAVQALDTAEQKAAAKATVEKTISAFEEQRTSGVLKSLWDTTKQTELTDALVGNTSLAKNDLKRCLWRCCQTSRQ